MNVRPMSLWSVALAISACATPAPPETAAQPCLDGWVSERVSPDGAVGVTPAMAMASSDSVAVYTGWISLAPMAHVAEHTHAGGDEIVFAVCGDATVTIAGTRTVLAPGMSVRVPRGQLHEVQAGGEGLVAVQIYTDPSAGYRFYEWPERSP